MNIDRSDTAAKRIAIMLYLMDHGVPLQTWGTNSHRSLEDFLAYMERDQFYFRPNGATNGSASGIIIDVHAVIVIVTHRYKGEWLELYEDRQVFDNGHKIERKGFDGIAETLKQGEKVLDGARRCLKEELQFTDPSLYTLGGHIETQDWPIRPSGKWPAIRAAYHRNIVECEIDRKLFRKGGYTEREGDRTIYFLWKPRQQMHFCI